LAAHRGSAFGGIGQREQPNTEQFENNLYREISGIDESYIWVEDESLQIGKIFLPEAFYERMIHSKLLFIDVPFDYRIRVLVSEYARQDIALLEEAITKIEQRLGNKAARQAIEALRTGKFAETARILLAYYDKTYQYGLGRRKEDLVHHLDLNTIREEDYAKRIIRKKDHLMQKKSPERQ